MAQYPHLFLPLKVGAHYLKNRIVMAPVDTGMETGDRLSNDYLKFYHERAENDVGLLIVRNGALHCTGTRHFSDPVISSAFLHDAIRLTNDVHAFGTKVILQLVHHGADSEHVLALGASHMRNPATGRTVRRMPGLLISHLICLYALRAYEAVSHGHFDGVEICGGHMSLPNTFSSPALNRRRDKWGYQGRLNFAVELVRRIRSFIGPSPILSYRMSLIDIDPRGSEWHDLLAFAQALRYEGVNLFSFDIGLNVNAVPVNTDLTPCGVWVPFMEKFSSEIRVPVIFGGKLRDPEKINGLLERNITCLAELGRPLIADKYWVAKVKREEKPVPWVNCPQGCLSEPADRGLPRLCCQAACIPLVPHERREGEKVLVVGGGPAGMAAARQAAITGYQVTLVDEHEELGGLYRLCAKIPGRSSVADLLQAKEDELVRLGVTIIKKTVVTPGWIEEHYNRHLLILATGRESVIPDIDGIDSQNVVTFEDLLMNRMPVGHRVAVIGSHPIAADIGRYLCAPDIQDYNDWLCAWGIGDPAFHKGGMLGMVPHLESVHRKLYLLSPSRVSLEERFRASRRLSELQWLRMHGANIFDRVTIEQIDPYSIRVRSDGEDSSSVFRVDHVVVADLLEPREELAKALDEIDRPYVTAGSMKRGTSAFYGANEASVDGREVVQHLHQNYSK